MPSAIFSLEFSVPGTRKGFMNNDPKMPIRIINLGILTIITMRKDHAIQFIDLLKRGVDLDQWLIENSQAVRSHKEQITRRAYQKAQEDVKASSEDWEQRYFKEAKRSQDLQQKNWELKQAINTLIAVQNENKES